MPYDFASDCPRCGTKSAGFSVREKERFTTASTYFFETFAVCGVCKKGVVAIFFYDGGTHLRTANLPNSRLTSMVPSPEKVAAPAHTPDNIAHFFKQGASSLEAGSHDAAGAMFRKTLETSLKEKFPDIKGTLKKRIDKAAQDHKLTPDLADWADHIRFEGNEATHGEEPYKAEHAREVKAFTELVLMYLYMLPGMLEEARQRGAENEDTGNSAESDKAGSS